MSWKDAFQYAKGVAASHGIDAAKKESHADDGLPFGARIGSLLSIQMSPFIRATANGSLIDTPAASESLIKAISRVKLGLSGNLYRYYLATGDSESEKEKFLQVYQNENGEVAEILYCTRLTRIIPETDEDQKAFTGEDGYGLGEKSYSLWKEQLAGLGYDASMLAAVFGDAASIDYRRDAGSQSDDFVAPFTGTKTRVDDAAGEHGLAQQIYFMPYVRDIGDGQEYLLISTEIVESQDGDASKRGIHFDLMIGLPIEKERVVIQ